MPIHAHINPNMECWALLLAAGQGSRLATATGGTAKQFLSWRGAPLWWASAMALAASPLVRGIVFVFPPDLEEENHALLKKMDSAQPLGVQWQSCHGGKLRHQSVHLGLKALPESCQIVLVHDSARPFLKTALVTRVAHAMQQALAAQQAAKAGSPIPDAALATLGTLGSLAPLWGGVVPGLPMSDTVKEIQAPKPLDLLDSPGNLVSPGNLEASAAAWGTPSAQSDLSTQEGPWGEMVARTPNRALLRTVQTPQAFPLALLRAVHSKYQAEQEQDQKPNTSPVTGAGPVTDDASLLERYGHAVLIVPGDPENIKITHPKDLTMLHSPSGRPCVGYGYDVHRYGGTRPLLLGGVPIPGPWHVFAHSDGDVLLHALMDAILGCMAAGDIGRHFPDNDPAWEGVSSALLLDHILDMAARAHLRLSHVDLTVIAQKPRLAPHANAIRRNVARLLALDESHVNVKATTEEGLGFTGQEQGLKAVALVSALQEEAGF